MTENNKPQASDDQQEQSGAFSDALKASREKADAEGAAPTRTLWSDAWKRLKKNKLAVIGAVWIVFVVLVALTADLWAPQLLGSPTDIDTTTVAQSSNVTQRDWPIVLGGVTVIVIVVMVINLLVDISYAFLDPRIRFGAPKDEG